MFWIQRAFHCALLKCFLKPPTAALWEETKEARGRILHKGSEDAAWWLQQIQQGSGGSVFPCMISTG